MTYGVSSVGVKGAQFLDGMHSACRPHGSRLGDQICSIELGSNWGWFGGSTIFAMAKKIVRRDPCFVIRELPEITESDS